MSKSNEFLVDLVAKRQSRLDDLYDKLDPETEQIVSEIVSIELELEIECNQ